MPKRKRKSGSSKSKKAKTVTQSTPDWKRASLCDECGAEDKKTGKKPETKDMFQLVGPMDPDGEPSWWCKHMTDMCHVCGRRDCVYFMAMCTGCDMIFCKSCDMKFTSGAARGDRVCLDCDPDTRPDNCECDPLEACECAADWRTALATVMATT